MMMTVPQFLSAYIIFFIIGVIMVFGELVIPSTRALWDDEEDINYTEYQSDLEWLNDSLPSEVNNLIIVDTAGLINLMTKCVVGNKPAINELKATEVYLYDIGNNNYLILCKNSKKYSSGEVTLKMLSLLKCASNVYGITSAPKVTYQGTDSAPGDTCVIRTLGTQQLLLKQFIQLEPPNLITGITANLLSFCIHINCMCQIFIGYLDSGPLDSLSSKPFIKLLKCLGIHTDETFILNIQAPSNNLYM